MYLQFLQTLASIPVQFISADKDGNGKVDAGEMLQAAMPLLMQVGIISTQFNAFKDHFDGYEAGMVAGDLRKLVSIQLLPATFSLYENSIDAFTLGAAKVVEGGFEMYAAIQAFPNKESKKKTGTKGNKVGKKAKV